MLSDRDARTLEARREELPRGIVPHGVRFLVAATDVQAHRWVVQVIGYGVDGERWIVDRFDVSVSARIDLGTGDALAADPAAYLEDWRPADRARATARLPACRRQRSADAGARDCMRFRRTRRRDRARICLLAAVPKVRDRAS